MGNKWDFDIGALSVLIFHQASGRYSISVA
jgi:hypothetical protein